MVDLHPVIAALLKPVGRVELAFPDMSARFPLLTITELSSASSAIYDGEERLTDVDWQVDVWDDAQTPQRCVQLAGQASDALIQAGFTRYFGQLMRDAAIPQRYTMRFRGRLDNKTMMMYRS